MSNYKCIRYRYVTSLEDMQLIYEIAERYTTIMKTDKEYRYSGKGTLKYISYVQDGDRYYKIDGTKISRIKTEKRNTLTFSMSERKNTLAHGYSIRQAKTEQEFILREFREFTTQYTSLTR